MGRHLVLIAAGVLMLLGVVFVHFVQPLLRRGSTVTVTLNGQRKEIPVREVDATVAEMQSELEAANRRAADLVKQNASLLEDVERWKEIAAKKGSPTAATPSTETKAGKDAEVDNLLASIDWARFMPALLAWVKADEENRKSGKPINVDKETLALLAEYNLKLNQLARLLGVANYLEVPFNEKVAPSFMRGWMEGLDIKLSSDQEEKLDEMCRTSSRSRAEEEASMQDATRLDRLAWEADRDLRWGQEMQKFLTPAQYDQYMAPFGNDVFWGRQANRQEVQAADVGSYWIKSLGLGDAQRATVDQVATQYAQDYQRKVGDFQARFPSNPPREEQMRLQVDLLRLQADAERQLGARLTLTVDQQERVKQGSGAILRLR